MTDTDTVALVQDRRLSVQTLAEPMLATYAGKPPLLVSHRLAVHCCLFLMCIHVCSSYSLCYSVWVLAVLATPAALISDH